jgi:hypothetical protein
VDDQELIASTRGLGMAVVWGRHAVCGPAGVGDSSVNGKCGIQVHTLLINLWKSDTNLVCNPQKRVYGIYNHVLFSPKT